MHHALVSAKLKDNLSAISDRIYRIIVYILVVIAHAVALVQFRAISPVLALPQKWQLQMYFLIGVSLAAASAIPLLKNTSYIWGLLFIRALMLLVAGMPMGNHMMLEFSLLTALILDATAYTPPWKNAVFSVLLLVMVVAMQRPLMISGNILSAPSNFDVLSFSLYSGIMIVFCLLVRAFRDQHRRDRELERMLEEATVRLVQTNMELQEYAAFSEQKAAESERKRLARDVHDALGYTLTNLIMMMEAAIDLSRPENTPLLEHLKRARDQAKGGLQEVRRTLQAIRRADTVPLSGLKVVHRLVTSFNNATHVRIKLHLGDVAWSFGAMKDQVVYRFVQEGISNALRHGKATEITISFEQRNGGVSISIHDNGVGFSGIIREGYGLLGMRERVEQVGGFIEIFSLPKEGTRISAWIPIDQAE